MQNVPTFLYIYHNIFWVQFNLKTYEVFPGKQVGEKTRA